METVLRVRQGEGVLDLCGQEAASLGSRALVVSSNRPETREVAALESLGRTLRRARVGNHPFPRVPRPGTPPGESIDLAAEAARESRCRLVIGLGDREPLNVARAAAGRALLPCILLPTVVGYGEPGDSDRFPLPEILILDARLAVGSPPERTAQLGVELFAGLMERHAGDPDGPEPAAADLLEQALRALVDSLPGAVNAASEPAHRIGLAEATGRAAEGMLAAGRGPAPLRDLCARLAPGVAGPGLLPALVPALLEAGSEGKGPISRRRAAELGRKVLGIRESDDGRAASWAAGGIRQWIVNLGLDASLPPAVVSRARADEDLRQVFAAALR